MKKILSHIKWHRIAWLVVAVCIGVLSLQAVDFRDVQKVERAAIRIDHGTGIYFVDTNLVMELLYSQRVYPGVSLAQSVPTEKVEKVLEGNPYCDNAEVYVDAQGTLHVDIKQRIPVVRIINTNGVGYYLDSTGTKLPLSDKFTARVLAASGNIIATDNNTDTLGNKMLNDVLKLSLALRSDDFLNRLTDQIWVSENGLVMVPKFVKQEVLLGNVDDLDKKLAKLSAFYRYTARTTLSNYKTIDLRYNNEIYAARRDYIPPQPVVTDTEKLTTPSTPN